MEDFEGILFKIDGIIETYESGAWESIENLRVMLRELTANIYYLTKYKIQAKNKHNGIRYLHKGSVASGEILAHEQSPELYQIRYIMRSANNVVQSIIMEISIIKKEM